MRLNNPEMKSVKITKWEKQEWLNQIAQITVEVTVIERDAVKENKKGKREVMVKEANVPSVVSFLMNNACRCQQPQLQTMDK